MAGATVNTGPNSKLFFTVSGTSTSLAVSHFDASLNAHVTSFINLDKGTTTTGTLGAQSPLPGTVLYTLGKAGDQFSIGSGQYTVDSVPGPSTIFGSAGGGDSVLAVGATGSTGLDYQADGGGNFVIFDDGDNLYQAMGTNTITGSLGDTGQDSIYAGAGFDTIDTGLGATSVFSGTGDAVINLNDSATSAFHRDVAVIHDGRNTVNANGAVDVVWTSAVDQVLNAGAGTDYFVLQPDSQSGVNNRLSGIFSGSGQNEITGGSGTTIIFDQTEGNTITSGSGVLYFVDGPDLPVYVPGFVDTVQANTINAAQGTIVAFLASDDSLTAAVSGSAAAYFVGGYGNETLNAAGSTGTVTFFGASNPTPAEYAVGASDSIVGGSGTNYFVTGVGNETLVAGAGTNAFYIEGGGSTGGTITILDFNSNSNDWAIAEGTQVLFATEKGFDGAYSLVYTMTDGTVVAFVGDDTINNHIFSGLVIEPGHSN